MNEGVARRGVWTLNLDVPSISGNKTVQIIGVFKLIKGLLLICLAAGAFTLLNSNLADFMTTVTHRLRVDPGNKYFRSFATEVIGLSPKLPLIMIGTLFYGILFCTEGTGLLMKKRWAEYLAVIATASFLPMEIYEIIQHASILKAVVTVLNAAIVAYLIIHLKKGKRDTGA